MLLFETLLSVLSIVNVGGRRHASIGPSDLSPNTTFDVVSNINNTVASRRRLCLDLESIPKGDQYNGVAVISYNMYEDDCSTNKDLTEFHKTFCPWIPNCTGAHIKTDAEGTWLLTAAHCFARNGDGICLKETYNKTPLNPNKKLFCNFTPQKTIVEFGVTNNKQQPGYVKCTVLDFVLSDMYGNVPASRDHLHDYALMKLNCPETKKIPQFEVSKASESVSSNLMGYGGTRTLTKYDMSEPGSMTEPEAGDSGGPFIANGKIVGVLSGLEETKMNDKIVQKIEEMTKGKDGISYNYFKKCNHDTPPGDMCWSKYMNDIDKENTNGICYKSSGKTRQYAKPERKLVKFDPDPALTWKQTTEWKHLCGPIVGAGAAHINDDNYYEYGYNGEYNIDSLYYEAEKNLLMAKNDFVIAQQLKQENEAKQHKNAASIPRLIKWHKYN